MTSTFICLTSIWHRGYTQLPRSCTITTRSSLKVSMRHMGLAGTHACHDLRLGLCGLRLRLVVEEGQKHMTYGCSKSIPLSSHIGRLHSIRNDTSSAVECVQRKPSSARRTHYMHQPLVSKLGNCIFKQSRLTKQQSVSSLESIEESDVKIKASRCKPSRMFCILREMQNLSGMVNWFKLRPLPSAHQEVELSGSSGTTTSAPLTRATEVFAPA